MSGICGVYFLDRRAVDCSVLEPMVKILAHRGPDGAGLWSEGAVGLGHRMLWTTPESLQEQLPLTNQGGDLVITADARIDNRVELIDALDLRDHPQQELPDGQLVLAAYAKWGERCPEKLLGDFAFAIWDKRKQELFCARDHFGVKPFYYYRSDRLFVFASEIKALLCLAEVPRRLNEVRVAEYLASMFNDLEGTFYKDILRLPPAHWLTVCHTGTRLRAYWCLNPSDELRLGSNTTYAEMFRGIFIEAVRCRLRSAFPVGSLLSGGLDSSSIACVARLLAQSRDDRLHTFSAIFDDVTQCDERPFIDAVLAQNGFEPHYVHGDQISPLRDLEHVLWHQDEAFFAPGMFLSWKLYEMADQQGVRILLDGFDGDSTISHGYGYPHELAQAGRWLLLGIEVRGLARLYGESCWRALWSYVRRYKLDPMLAHSRTLRFAKRVWQVQPWRRRHRRTPSANRPGWSAIINPDFVQRVGLRERYQSWHHAQSTSALTERWMHYQTLTSGIHPFALEVFDKAAAAFALEPRYPFWDKRLVEFCLALPPEQKLHRGRSRLVLRRGMADILPVEVQWRVSKVDFLPNLSHGLLAFERQRLDEVILKESAIIGEYVDIPCLRTIYHRFVARKADVKPIEVFAIWKAVSLALWLRHITERGLV